MKHIRKFEAVNEKDPLDPIGKDYTMSLKPDSDISKSQILPPPPAKKYSGWQLSDKIEKIVNSNIKEIPYEGTEVNTHGLREDILSLIYEIAPEYKPKDNNY